MPRIIFHIDVNSAYLSWSAVEQLKNGAETDLRKIPAIIGGDRASRHGVVLAKSISAKKYGIRTGEPVVDAIRKCPNLVIAPPDHRLYSDYSRKLMTFLRVQKGYSKATAIEFMRQHLGLTKDEVYVFGDSSNDQSMFEYAKHSIAMKKHDPVLDPYTEYVTDTVENDGVYKAMQHYGLI